MDRALAKRWFAGHAAAEARARQVRSDEGPLPPELSFARSMELLDLVDADDAFREHDVESARTAWTKLKAWVASRDRG